MNNIYQAIVIYKVSGKLPTIIKDLQTYVSHSEMLLERQLLRELPELYNDPKLLQSVEIIIKPF